MSSLYRPAADALLEGKINWIGGGARCLAVSFDDYTPDFEVDEFLSDISVVAWVARSALLTGKTIVDGVASCADFQFTDVPVRTIDALVYYIDTGSPSTSRLLCLVDAGTDLPHAWDGATVDVTITDGVLTLWPGPGV